MNHAFLYLFHWFNVVLRVLKNQFHQILQWDTWNNLRCYFVKKKSLRCDKFRF